MYRKIAIGVTTMVLFTVLYFAAFSSGLATLGMNTDSEYTPHKELLKSLSVGPDVTALDSARRMFRATRVSHEVEFTKSPTSSYTPEEVVLDGREFDGVRLVIASPERGGFFRFKEKSFLMLDYRADGSFSGSSCLNRFW